MATFVKKQNSTNYYQVDGYRAAGIIPYFKKDDKYYILMNTEIRSKKEKFHFLGGKVELRDKTIQDTALREANEECGYLLNTLITPLYRELIFGNIKFIKIAKSKYISFLIDISESNINHWLNLPEIYNRLFKGKQFILKHNESIKLHWKSLNYLEDNFNKLSYLGRILIYKFKQKLDIDSDSKYTFLD